MADKMFSDIDRVMEQIGKDKGIDKQVVVEAVTQGMLVAARKKYGTYRDIEAQFNEETGEIELYEFKEVVTPDKFEDELIEIILDEALALDPEAQLTDTIGIRLDIGELGRIAVQTARQIILQKVRDAEREIIYSEFEQKRGDIASGIARRVERGSLVVDLGRTEAYIPPREQIPGETYRPGDRLQGFIADVRQTTRGPQIIMSRADNRYLMKLFEAEVPEIQDGIVEMMAAAREPGHRAKIAVATKEASVDPVGACVGMRGSRVQNVVQELQGEKIDIVPWDEDITQFACNALAPAEVSRVFLDEENKEMEIVVPDNQLSLAIGKRGQNVRLAAKLTGWRLDIMSETNAASRTAESIFNLMLIPGMDEVVAHNLFQSGFGSFQVISQTDVEDVMLVSGYEETEKAQKLIEDCKALIEDYKAKGEEIPKAPVAVERSEKMTGGMDAKALAEHRLKEEMAQLMGQQEKEKEEKEEKEEEEKREENTESAEGEEVEA